jgi:hypothetical protein
MLDNICMKMTAMIYLDNYYSQFCHPFCEEEQQLILATGEAIVLYSITT